MKIGLILSNDWEVFGDGSGDYFVVQHRPLEECLDVVGKYGAKITVMAEVGQQWWGFKRLGEQEEWASEIANVWEEILCETIRQGSDVQLHLHPQWLDAKYVNKKWELNLNKWSIARLDPLEAEEALRQGKQYLEELLKPVDANYQCHSFRAGAYCIQPSTHIIPILQKLGFLCDTSVTKGYRDTEFYDYRNAASNMIPWFAKEDVRYSSKDATGLLEIPIYSFKMIDSFSLRAVLGKSRSRNLFYKLNYGVSYVRKDMEWFAERDRIRAERYPVQNRPYQSPMHKLKGLFSSVEGLLSTVIWPTTIQLDYDYVPPNVFVKGIERLFKSSWAKRHKNDDIVLPIMASGHVKNMHNADNLDRILELMNKTFEDQLMYWTLTDAVNYWTSLTSSVKEL